MALLSSVGRATPGTTAAIDTTGAQFLVAWTANYGSTGTLSDSQSNTWTPLTLVQWDVTGGRGRLYYCQAPSTSATHTFSFDQGDAVVYVMAFSNAYTYDGQQNTSSNDTTPGSAGTITPVAAGSLIVAGASSAGGAWADKAIGSGFTLTGDIDGSGGSNQSLGLAYLEQVGGPTAVDPEWTGSNNAGSVGFAIASFGDTGGGDPVNDARIVIRKA